MGKFPKYSTLNYGRPQKSFQGGKVDMMFFFSDLFFRLLTIQCK